LVVAAVTTVAVAGCATEVTGTPMTQSGAAVGASSKTSSAVATDFTAWADAYCTTYSPLVDALLALDEIPADGTLDARSIPRIRKALEASLPALDALIAMPAPPIADGKQLEPLLDAGNRAWKSISTDIVAILDANPQGLDETNGKQLDEAVAQADPGLSKEERARIEEFNSRLETLGVPSCDALDAGAP